MRSVREPAARPAGQVVVAYDARWQAEKLLLVAATEAERRGRPLSIVTLIDTPADESGDQDRHTASRPGHEWTGKTSMARIVAEIGDGLARRFPQLPIATHCMRYDAVTSRVEPFAAANLLVIGARNLHGHLAFAPDSPSNRFLSAMSCPVLALSDAALDREPELGEGLVVVGLSGEAADAGVGAAAAAEAEARDASIQFLHSFGRSRGEPMSRLAVRGLGVVASALPADVETDGKVSITLTREAPVPALIRASHSAHLLVLGSRAGSLTGNVLGSVSRRVLAAAACPVLVVRAEDAPPARLPGEPTSDNP
jgi:nucleotide-binding universal stress UspA family protein